MDRSYPAAIRIHDFPIRQWITQHTAARIAMRAVITATEYRRPGLLPLDIHFASGCRVNRHFVAIRGFIRGLQDVDLAVRRPVIPVREPERWPRAAAIRGVDDIEDKQTGVIPRFRLDAHRVPTTECVRGERIDPQDGRIFTCVGEIEILSRVLIHIPTHVSWRHRGQHQVTYTTKPFVGSSPAK